ncbi:hypothetical protein PI95_033715 [Hassallia byssoidea VB512170]|jgi:6-phospho-beta-glucosidase|uniref:Glycosyl hydrolase family 4 C-terminal domain-containing protein n=1 Tax=Hassallia byssoidea VB512170 TaxID=1304833 RepID=A0A846HL15_9CYAN|nr:hypothetical protein [Hassalia byssoidea]MBW4571857.1 hypothetical protein [Tolypothrix carrinoi HA7290-LM1]NEU77309.1 hypothetical protein [Hassalia byssoidea VB512170]
MSLTLSIIGAGSNYTPVLIDYLLKSFKEFPFGKIVLMDIVQDRLDIIKQFVEHQFETYHISVTLELCCDLRYALQNTDFVFTMYRVGGLNARYFDTLQAIKHGILGQETQGWGGFISALRNIPVAVQICEILQELSPQAWMINITNPVGIITQACFRIRKERTIGICEIPVQMLLSISEVLNIPQEEIKLSYTGLNHLSWITDIVINNQSIIDTVLENHIDHILQKLLPNHKDLTSLVYISRSSRVIPSPYLQYYYLLKEITDQICSYSKTRAEKCKEIDQILMQQYSLHDPEWIKTASLRGGFLLGPAIATTINEILCPSNRQIFPCVPNKGNLAFLPETAVVETPVKIENNYLIPQQQHDLHPHLRGLISQVAAYEQLTVEAGIYGNYNVALAALATHPLIPSLPIAKRMLDEMLCVHKQFLPQFQ